jgi:hypothetical protein
MTFEQKVDKLKGIVDSDVVVWCETDKEDNDMANLANSLIEKDDEKYDCDSTLYKTKYNVKLEDGNIMVNYLGYNLKKENAIPYSEFFKDKVEDKPIEEWTLKECKDYCREHEDRCSSCIITKFCNYSEEAPCNWDLTLPLKLTQSEIDILKAIKVLYPLNNNLTLKYVAEPCGFSVYPFNIFIQLDRLPSLSRDATYSISELLEGVD